MDSIYIRIAGFIIRLNFVYKSEHGFDVFTSTLKRDISQSIKNLIIDPLNKLDFSITFAGRVLNNGLARKGNKVFSFTFEEKNNRHIIALNQLSVYQFQLLFIYVILKLLIKNDGFSLHSSSCLINDKIFLFVGKSGAGKTTISNMLGNSFKKIGDENSIIRKIKGKYVYHQMPFIDSTANKQMIKPTSNLGGIFFIKKSKSTRLVKILDKERVINTIIESLATEENDLRFFLKNVVDFVDNFDKFYFLYFSKEKAPELIKLLKEI